MTLLSPGANVDIADQNASSKYALFMASPAGLSNSIAMRSSCVPGSFPMTRSVHGVFGSKVCAELLGPHQLPPDYIFRALAHHATTQDLFQATSANIPCVVNPDVFLR